MDPRVLLDKAAILPAVASRVLLLVSLSQYYAKECQGFKNMLS